MNNVSIEQRMNGEHPLVRLFKVHDLLAYFVLTFIFTFGGWLAAMFTGFGTLFDIGLWGPAFSAILITAVTRGMPGIKEIFRRLLHWRVRAKWYLIIFFGWPVISILAALLHAQTTNQTISFHWDAWSATRTFLNSALILGFWACEEIGWRGFALPRLLNRWNALFSSIVLGLVWWLWHLPFFVGTEGISPEFYPYVVLTVSISILMTWVLNHTNGSVFVAIFFHFWINIYDAFQADKLTLADPAGETSIKYLLLAGAAILVVVLYGYRRFTRVRKSAVPLELNATEL